MSAWKVRETTRLAGLPARQPHETCAGMQQNVEANLPSGTRLVVYTTADVKARLEQSFPWSHRVAAEQPSSAQENKREGWELPRSVVALTRAAAQEGALPEGCGSTLQPAAASTAKTEPIAVGCGSSQPQAAASSAAGEPARDTSPAQAQQVVLYELDWQDYCTNGRRHDRLLRPPCDLLLVADVVRCCCCCSISSTASSLCLASGLGLQVYEAEAMSSLLRCMWQLSGPDTTVLLAYYERSKAAHRVFWDLLPLHFTATKVPEALYGASQHPAGVGLFQLGRLDSIRQAQTEADLPHR